LTSPPPSPPKVAGKKRKRDTSEWDDEIQEYRDWVGRAALAIPDDEADEDLGDEGKKGKAGTAHCLSWTGFWHPLALESVVQKVASVIKSKFVLLLVSTWSLFTKGPTAHPFLSRTLLYIVLSQLPSLISHRKRLHHQLASDRMAKDRREVKVKVRKRRETLTETERQLGRC
jgi:hypothetical protein